MSEEQMDEVQRWIGEAVARNLKPLLYAMYVGVLFIVAGTASVVGVLYELREGNRAAREDASAAKNAIETQIKPAIAKHDTRLALLEFIRKVPGK